MMTPENAEEDPDDPNQRMREISKLNTPLTGYTAKVQSNNKNN